MADLVRVLTTQLANLHHQLLHLGAVLHTREQWDIFANLGDQVLRMQGDLPMYENIAETRPDLVRQAQEQVRNLHLITRDFRTQVMEAFNNLPEEARAQIERTNGDAIRQVAEQAAREADQGRGISPANSDDTLHDWSSDIDFLPGYVPHHQR